MTEKEKRSYAETAIDKNLDYENLIEYMYGITSNEETIESIYDYVIECKEIGTIAYNKKYEELNIQCGDWCPHFSEPK